MNLPAKTSYDDDGFAVQDRDGGSLISGKMLKFTDGKFFVDKVEQVPIGTKLAAVAMITAWVHWKDGKPVEHRVTLAGEKHPEREELPDQDESLWPNGLNGEPEEPWKDTRYLHLVNQETGADFTFVTDSFGGRRGVSELRRQIANVRGVRPNAMPIVELASVSMKTKFGIKPRPEFKVIDWRKGMAPEQAAPKLPPGGDMDDDIPF
jgi:hypothetical protein